MVPGLLNAPATAAQRLCKMAKLCMSSDQLQGLTRAKHPVPPDDCATELVVQAPYLHQMPL